MRVLFMLLAITGGLLAQDASVRHDIKWLRGEITQITLENKDDLKDAEVYGKVEEKTKILESEKVLSKKAVETALSIVGTIKGVLSNYMNELTLAEDMSKGFFSAVGKFASTMYDSGSGLGAESASSNKSELGAESGLGSRSGFSSKSAFGSGSDFFSNKSAFGNGSDFFSNKSAFGNGSDFFSNKSAFGNGSDFFSNKSAFGSGSGLGNESGLGSRSGFSRKPAFGSGSGLGSEPASSNKSGLGSKPTSSNGPDEFSSSAQKMTNDMNSYVGDSLQIVKDTYKKRIEAITKLENELSKVKTT